MDLGNVAWMMALLLGIVVAAPLGALSFKTVMRVRGTATKRASQQSGINEETFRAFEERLRQAVASAVAKARMPTPSLVPAGSSLVWVQVVVHICEYSATHKDLGSADIRQASEQPPTAREVDLIVERTNELLNGGALEGKANARVTHA